MFGMSPELSEALKDRDVAIALKRLYNYRKLRDLDAPLVVIERSSQLLDKSRDALGARFDGISAALFVEFKVIEDAAFKAEQDWEAKCQTCSSWNGGYNNQSEDQWCLRHSCETRTIPRECPDYTPGKADGE
jgi:hypothetical protein